MKFKIPEKEKDIIIENRTLAKLLHFVLCEKPIGDKYEWGLLHYRDSPVDCDKTSIYDDDVYVCPYCGNYYVYDVYWKHYSHPYPEKFATYQFLGYRFTYENQKKIANMLGIGVEELRRTILSGGL